MSNILFDVTYVIAAVLLLYGLRHLTFTLYRLYRPQSHLFESVPVSNWPRLAVFIAAHNEEAVIADCLRSLVACDYPRDRLVIVPVNDRSTDGTRAICDEFAALHPGLIVPFHRTEGLAGKAAAMKDASERYLRNCDALIIFDADYQPGAGLLKKLVTPLIDPSIGATMGRVVPLNGARNLLTRLLDIERSSGYQVDQQARQGLGLVAQYGGTVGAIRLSALRQVGGFHPDVLAEDTDLTYRLLLQGWKVQYLNTAECYEEVPEDWRVRAKQVKRWAKGHNQAMLRYFWPTLRSAHVRGWEKFDALALLFAYSLAPLTLLAWVCALLGLALEPGLRAGGAVLLLALAAYTGFGNLAPFFQTAVAVRLDGNRQRLQLLAFALVGYLVNAFAVTQAVGSLLLDAVFKRQLHWDKTVRYRAAPSKESAS